MGLDYQMQLDMSGVLNIIRLLSLVALLLTCLLIINTVATLIAEQVKVVGTMKAIGGTRLVIMRSYLFSVEISAIIGTLLGLLASWYVLTNIS